MDYDNQAHDRAAADRSVRMIALAALVVALTGPLWVPGMLGALNFRASADLAAEQNRRDITQLEQAAAAADQRVKAAEAAAAAVKADLGRLEQRVTAMREALAGGAAADLGRALRGEHEFARELAALRAFMAPPADVADMLTAITPFAEVGVPTMRELRYRFMTEVQGIGGGPASAMAWLRRAVTFSAPEPVEPPNPNLIEAAGLLRDDDLVGAMAALRRIEPRPDWLNTWMKEASARASADALLPRLDRTAGVR